MSRPSHSYRPKFMSLFRCLGRTEVSVRVRGFVCEYFVTKIRFRGEELLAPRPSTKLEDHPLSAVRHCWFNIFTATLHIGGRSSIRNLRTRHAVVTGTHLSHVINTQLFGIIVGVVPYTVTGCLCSPKMIP
jgi:hypothetical protein